MSDEPRVPQSRELAEHHWQHGNYDGQGKTGPQEAHDTTRSCGIIFVVVLVIIVLTIVYFFALA